FSSRRRHTRLVSDWSSDVCSSDLGQFLWIKPKGGLALLNQRLFVAAVRHTFGISLRVVADVAGANPIQEQPVYGIIAQEFLEDRELVLPDLRKREAEL